MGSVSYGLGADLSLSPSLPVGDDRYLNLSSQKRPTGRNLGGNRLVRRSGTTSRVVDAVSVCATNSIKLLNGSNINVIKFTTFLRPGPP
ncbi:hypothetical protein P5673_020077 [Acropora cervicornis]|uniref:Uncharacterized protein n=1 Tax=Acropora cervicornis TaxID=6130 RepID=A0AAD9QAB6_ACRCE|nr:hypothetical protein P5673_020077 [Acropora cervicornis]